MDPGYISRPTADVAVDDEEQASGDAQVDLQQVVCQKCRTFSSDQAYHDSLCDLCVQGYDHFCIVLGNIIGKNNIKFFYAIFMFYVANVGLLMLSIMNSNAGK